jgi:hypothetical protein
LPSGDDRDLRMRTTPCHSVGTQTHLDITWI